MIQKTKTISAAWISVFKDAEVSELEKERFKICYDCKFLKKKKLLEFVNGGFKEAKGYVCSDCHCPIVAKLKVPENHEEKCKHWKK